MKISNSNISFQGVYVNSRAEDTYEDWKRIDEVGLTFRVAELLNTTKNLNTDVVILPSGEYGAQIVEAKDVCDADTYTTVGYLSESESLLCALDRANRKLLDSVSKKPKETRERFPGTKSRKLDAMG